MKMRFIPYFLVAAMAFNLMLFPSTVFAAASGTFDILSGSSAINTGESFTVTVVGKNIQDMYACEVRLIFDNTLLNFVNLTSDVQGSQHKILPKADENTILFAVAKYENQLPETGDVTLCTITFTGKAEGIAKVTLNTIELMDEILRSTDYSVKKTIEVSVAASPTPPPNFEPLPDPASPIDAPVQIITVIPEIVPLDAVTSTARVDLGEKARDIFAMEGVSVISIPPVPGTDTYTLSIPADSLSGTLGGGLLNFTTGTGSITISGNMLAGIPEAEGKEIDITIGGGDKASLPDDLKETIGDRPLVQLTLSLGGIQSQWNNPQAPVTVSIPYTPTAEELVDPEHIVVWYIDGEGNIISVPNGRYDTETGRVTFTVTHFSYYAVAYVHKTFGDLDSVAWAKKSIEVLASKGIIAGTGGNAYSPTLNITRADYLLLLVRTLGLWAEVEDNYDDVEPGTYYYEGVGIARKLGITLGVGNNRFLPREPITRQDMMVLTVRAMKIAGKLDSTGDLSALNQFGDKSQVASYAGGPIAALVEAGLIMGNKNLIYPLANATRAETAVLMYRIYNME